MNAHENALLNLLNELWKAILSLYRNPFNKFNNKGARIVHSIYHMTSELLEIAFMA